MNFAQAIMRFVKNFTINDYLPQTLKAVLEARSSNATIRESDNGSTPGKLRSFKMTYFPPLCTLEGDCEDTVCDSGQTLTPNQITYNLSKCTASPVFEIEVDGVRAIDDLTNDELIGEAISQLVRSARESLSKDILTILISKIGCLPNGQPTKTVNLINPATGQFNPLGSQIVDLAFMDAKLKKPYVIGGSSVYLADVNQKTSKQTIYGQDLTKTPLSNWYYDNELDKALANSKENLLAFDPSVFKFISWNKNAGRFATNLKDINGLISKFADGSVGPFRGVILDPVTGLLWDLDGQFETCPDRWKFQIRLQWDLFFLPQRVCNIDCVTGIMRFESCPVDIVECPGVTPPTPVTPSESTWAGLASYPTYVQTLEINGFLHETNTNVTTEAELITLMNAVSGLTFVASGTDISFTGYSIPTVKVNGVAGTFVAVP
jgi:hypothetical protein